MLYREKEFQIYFGDAADAQHLPTYLALREKLKGRPEFARAFRELALQDLFFLHQVHGIAGTAIDENNKKEALAFAQDGDFLITNQPGVGIGVMTADCVPVMIVDTTNHAIAAIHAGWRGAVAGIVKQTIDELAAHYGSKPGNLQLFIGPSAKSCCYQVGPEFPAQLSHYPHHEQFFRRDQRGLYFDLVGLILDQLARLGISPDAITTRYNLCTICNPQFCSYRRGDLEMRQMTVVALKETSAIMPSVV